MLYGAVGRTDLIGPDQTEQLTRAQYRSVRRLAAELPEEVAVYPTHGFGSFCSATPTAGTSSTIGNERQANVALRSDEDAFVKELIAGLNAYPRYYAHMGPANRRGPRAPDLARPATGRPGRTAAAHRRRRMDRGPARAPGVRPRPPHRHHLRRTRRLLQHLSGLGHPLGHAAHPDRRNPRSR